MEISLGHVLDTCLATVTMEDSQSGPEAGDMLGIKMMRRMTTMRLSEDPNRPTTKNNGVTEIILQVLHLQRMEMVELFLIWLVSDLLFMPRNLLLLPQVKPTESTPDQEVSLMMKIFGDDDCRDSHDMRTVGVGLTVTAPTTRDPHHHTHPQ